MIIIMLCHYVIVLKHHSFLLLFSESNKYNKNYAIHLKALAVYVSSGKTGEELCGKISNDNDELILQREQKLTCNKRINGRYIRIQPEARLQSSSGWYSAVICEVMAFT